MLSGQPTFDQLGTAVEHLGKLHLSLRLTQVHGHTPSVAEIRKQGHQTRKLAEAATTDIRAAALGEGRSYVVRIADAVQADPYWPLVLGALDTAADASQGRYRAANRAHGQLTMKESAEAQWQAAESLAADRLGLLVKLSEPDAIHGIRVELCASIVRWWFLIVRGWQHGLDGPKAKQLSGDLDALRRRLPEDLQLWLHAFDRSM